MIWGLAVLLSVSCFADTLTLKSGRVVAGTYLGGSAGAVRFSIGDRVENYPVASVERIAFGNPSALPARSNSVPDLPLPVADGAQERFCAAVESYRDAAMRYANEPNPIRRAETKNPDPYDWEDKIASIMGTSGRFENWRGTVRFSVEGSWVALSFFPSCRGLGQAVEFSTAPRYRLGLSENETLLPLNSQAARVLGNLRPNGIVIASGHLFRLSAAGRLTVKSDLRQRYRNAIGSAPASVNSPRYLAAFDRIEAQ